MVLESLLSPYRFCPVCGSSRFVVSGVRSKRCKACGFEFFLNSSASVAAFIVNAKGELLVCRRAKEPEKGTFDLPGGFVDPGESAEQALSRELSEELGCLPAESHYLFSLPNRYQWGAVIVPTTDCFFRVTLADKTKLCPHDDVASFSWIPLTDVDPQAFGLKSIATAVARFQQEFKD